MKQMKFFLVALMAVVMGMSVTSCMNGDDNTQVNDLPVLGKVIFISSFNDGFNGDVCYFLYEWG